MTDRHYLRPLPELRDALTILLGWVEAQDAESTAAEEALRGALDELESWRALIGQRVGIHGEGSVSVIVGPDGVSLQGSLGPA